jgi:hypothetical protein
MLRRQRLDKDLDEELRSHLKMRAADNAAAGMSPEQARYEAHKRFGNITLLKEDTRKVAGWTKPHSIFVTHSECCGAARVLPSSPSSLSPLVSVRIPRSSPS